MRTTIDVEAGFNRFISGHPQLTISVEAGFNRFISGQLQLRFGQSG